MKKRLLSVALAVVMVVCLVACGTYSPQIENETSNSPFVIVYRDSDVWIFADKETNVEYVMVNNSHGGVGFQPLYNADGTLKLYED